MSFSESLIDLVEANENALLSAHPSWRRIRLAEVCEILNGYPFPSRSFRPEGGTPLLRIRDVLRGETRTRYVGSFEPQYLVRHGELVVGMDGDFNCALWRGEEALLNQRVCKITADDRFYDLGFLVKVLPGYLQAINAKTSAITVKHLSSKTIADIPLPLPPREEQRRLVAEVDSYFTRLDDAEAMLERVQRSLKRYRTSVLQAAVEGRLVQTEAELARAEGRDYEPASVLLRRILAVRRRNEPAGPATELPRLPAGWCWSTVGQLGEVSGGLTQNAQRKRLLNQLPFLRVANVYADELRLDDMRTIGVTEAELPRVRLSPGDLLVVEGNGSIEQIGRVARWDGSVEPCLHQNHLIKVRFAPVELGSWALFWLLSSSGRHWIERVASSTAGLYNLSLSKIRQLPIPLPPLAEQLRITEEVDRLTTIASAAEHELRSTAARCKRLRQSILKWAFEGRLLDQDPTDEPASVLLERIRAQRHCANRVGATGRQRRSARSKAPSGRPADEHPEPS